MIWNGRVGESGSESRDEESGSVRDEGRENGISLDRNDDEGESGSGNVDGSASTACVVISASS